MNFFSGHHFQVVGVLYEISFLPMWGKSLEDNLLSRIPPENRYIIRRHEDGNLHEVLIDLRKFLHDFLNYYTDVILPRDDTTWNNKTNIGDTIENFLKEYQTDLCKVGWRCNIGYVPS